MPGLETMPSDVELSAKINRMLTLKRLKSYRISKNTQSSAIKSLDSLLLECQDFVNEILGSDESSLHKEITPSLIYEKEVEDSRKSSKIFLGAIQSLNIPIFGKTSHQHPRKTRFSFESFKTQISKMVTAYRLPTPPLEDGIPDKNSRSKSLNSLKYTKSVFF